MPPQRGSGQVHRQDQIVPIQSKIKGFDVTLATKVGDERSEPSNLVYRRYHPYGPPRDQGTELAHNGDVAVQPRRGATSDPDGTAHVFAHFNNLVLNVKFTPAEVDEYNRLKQTKNATVAKEYLFKLLQLYTMKEYIPVGIYGVTVRKNVNQQIAVFVGYGSVLIRNDGNQKIIRKDLVVAIPPAQAGKRFGYPDQGAGKDIARCQTMGYAEALERFADVLPKPSDAAAAECRELLRKLESMEKGKKQTHKDICELSNRHRLVAYGLGTGILEDWILGPAQEDIFAGGQGHVGYKMRN